MYCTTSLLTVLQPSSWFWQIKNNQHNPWPHKTHDHTYKLTVSAVDSDPVHLSPYDRGSFLNFVMLSFCEYVFQNGVCVSQSECVSWYKMLMQGACEVCLSVSKKALNQHTHCLHVLSVYVDVWVWVSVVLCFFSTSIFSVSVFQSVMKDKWTVDDSLMVWLMPHSSSFLRERYCSPEEWL